MKKPFYKDFWFYFLSLLTFGIFLLFIIPYGLNDKSVGEQLVDTAEQFTQQYVYDEKARWTDEQWNEYWEKHPEYTAYNSGTDWESHPSGNEVTDARLDELPFDYAKLWNIDFSDLETTDQYDALVNQPILDKAGKPLQEEFIYREKSTGNWIIDVTLDGFILRLPSAYRAGWNIRSDRDPNGFNKFEKALNLQLIKNIGNKECRIEIAPYDIKGPVYRNEVIDHPLYDLTMRYNLALDKPDHPRRFLNVKLDEAPYNTDNYAITINSTSPIECFNANLEMEILNSMQFLPPELKEQGMDYDELHRFPIPYYWPKNVNEAIKITKNETKNEQEIEYQDYKFEIDPKWRIEYNNEKHQVNIIISRRCNVSIGEWKDWQTDLKERGAKNLDDYFEIANKPILNPEWGVESISGTIKKVSTSPYEIYKGEGIIDVGEGDKIVNRDYLIKNKEKLISIDLKIEDPFEDVRPGDCDAFGEKVFDSFEFLE